MIENAGSTLRLEGELKLWVYKETSTRVGSVQKAGIYLRQPDLCKK